MKPHPLNQLAIWLPMNTDELSIKAYGAGYPYLENGIVMRSSLTNPVTRYAKNYTKSKKQYSLCIITNEPDVKKIEAWLDQQAENIKPKDITPEFKLTKVQYGKD